MKKKLITLVTVFALVMSMALLAACTTPAGNSGATGGSAAVERDGLPNNLPNADHIGYIELQTRTGKECQTCHMTTDDKGTPIQADAGVMPEDHYVDGSYASKQFDPQRIQCNSCHGGPAPSN